MPCGKGQFKPPEARKTNYIFLTLQINWTSLSRKCEINNINEWKDKRVRSRQSKVRMRGRVWRRSEGKAGDLSISNQCMPSIWIVAAFLFCWDTRGQQAGSAMWRKKKLRSAMEMMEVKVYVSGWGDIAMKVYKYPRPECRVSMCMCMCMCGCVCRVSMSVTEDYLNKLRSSLLASWRHER